MHAAVVAGAIALDAVMVELARQRPVFHSEGDLRFSFAAHVQRAAAAQGRDVEARFDVFSRHLGAATVPLLLLEGAVGTIVELAYAPSAWSGATHRADGVSPERVDVHQQGPPYLARQRYVSALERVEEHIANTAFQQSVGCTRLSGLVLLLTNAPGLWTPPVTAPTTHDRQFRLHEGRVLQGRLAWGTGSANRTRLLRGSSPLAWHDYSLLDPSPHGLFRWLAVEPIPSRA